MPQLRLALAQVNPCVGDIVGNATMIADRCRDATAAGAHIVVICEDIWQVGGPITALAQAGVDLVVAPNASPYERNKDDTRLALVARRAIEVSAPLVYANLVGGQDELVFDGDSMVVGERGQL